MLRVILVMAAALVCAPAPVAANWQNILNVDEFDGKHRWFALTSATEPFLGFVCEAETGRIKLLFKTKKRTTRDLRDHLPAPASIAVIVDDQPARSLPGRVADIGRKFSVESYDDSIFDLAKALATSKRRVLVAIDWLGSKQFREEFSTAGAGAAIFKVVEVCRKQKQR